MNELERFFEKVLTEEMIRLFNEDFSLKPTNQRQQIARGPNMHMSAGTVKSLRSRGVSPVERKKDVNAWSEKIPASGDTAADRSKASTKAWKQSQKPLKGFLRKSLKQRQKSMADFKAKQG
jgi:hypothetical protein